MRYNWGLRRRLVFIVVGISVLTVLATAVIALNANVSSLRVQTEQALTRHNQALANALDGELQLVVTAAQMFAAALDRQPDAPALRLEPLVSHYLADGSRLIRRVNVYAPVDDRYQMLTFNAPGGGQVTDGAAVPESWLMLVLSASVQQWSLPAHDSAPVISYAVPYDLPGQPRAAVVWVDVPAASLGTVMQAILRADMKRGYTLLVTGSDNLLAAYNLPDSTATSRAAGLFDQAEVRQLRDRVQLDGGLLVTTDPVSGQDAVIVVNILPQTGWQLVSVLPSNALHLPFDRPILQVMIVTLMGMIGLAVAVFHYISAAVTEPLHTLGNAAQEIGSGDLRYDIGFQNRRDEIGRLAQAMDDMKRNLAYSYRQLSMWSQTLETRVEQRTQELEIARLEAQAAAGEIRAVYDASLSVVSDYQLEALLRRLNQNILDLLQTRYCAVWLLEGDHQYLRLVEATSPDRIPLNTRVSINEGLVGLVTREARLVVVNDYAVWPERLSQFTDDSFAQVMSAPLTFFNRPIGAVLVGRLATDPPFSEREQRLLVLFANLVSPVVRNARLFEQREDAVKAAERANSVKTRFLASVTHELRTPLNLIINNLDFMRIGEFGPINPDQRVRLDQTIRSAEHLLYLINDLLDVSKIEAGEMKLFVQPSDVYPVVEDALDSAMMLIESRSPTITLEAHLPENLPPVPMDARRIRQVLTNLLTNAVKFTLEGSVRLVVNLYPDHIEFVVTDTGIGIPPEEMDKLFQPFERTDRAKHLGIEGTGLGLPISRFLVQAHGGQMTVRSTVNQGSTFAFTLPLEPSEEVTRPVNVIAAE